MNICGAKGMFNWTHVTGADITFTTKIRKATLVETQATLVEGKAWGGDDNG